MTGDYEISGQILVLPISGKGKFNTTLIRPKTKTNTTAEVYEKKGKKYIKFKKYTITNEPEKSILNFDNLFNGNKQLGDEMNKFLNEHEKEIYAEMKGPFDESFSLVFQQLGNRLMSKIPLEEMFPDDKERFQ